MGIVYSLISGPSDGQQPLVFLHGSGQNEHSLLSLVAAAKPKGPAVLLRGGLEWENGYAFIRRRPDRTVDENNVVVDTARLNEALQELAIHRQWNHKPVLIGFSNGAIAAAALLMLYPDSVDNVALLRPLSPFTVPPAHDLGGKRALLIEAAQDQRRTAGDAPKLAACLSAKGAIVTHQRLDTGHGLQPADAGHLQQWLDDICK